MSVENEFEPFGTVIKNALAKRGLGQDDYERHADFSAPNYVVRLCASLAQEIQKAGYAACTLADVVRLEATCTGTDYAHKLAMRCKRLTEKQAA